MRLMLRDVVRTGVELNVARRSETILYVPIVDTFS